MDTVTLKLGTFQLDSGGTYAISGLEIQETKTVNTYKIPKTDGSVAELGKRDYITINVGISVTGTDFNNLTANMDALKAALQNGLQNFTLDGVRYMTCQLSSLDKIFTNVRRLMTVKAVFIAHYPFWLSQTENDDSRVPTSGVGYVVNNAGNAPARCKISITALSSPIVANLGIQNQTNNLSFQYEGTLLGYNTFIVDNRYTSDDFLITNNAADDSPNYEGDFILLQPGNNTIVYTGPNGVTVDLKWRDTWY